ncbi:MAG: cytochrome c oxidase subunit 3 family protein [Planctomycetota bacterium]
MATIDSQQHTRPALADRAVPRWQRYVPGHHWKNAHDEFEGAKIGMWLFLTTEVLLFAGLFVAYAVFRMKYPEAFINGSHYLDWRFGFINTCVLLLSSFTVAWSVRNAQLDERDKLVRNLFISVVCGGVFLAIKFIFEYGPKWAEGKRPGSLFSYPNAENAYEPIWWGVYYGATAIHAAHVVIGMALLTWVMVGAMKGKYGPKHYTSVENVGLYWHLVDLIWIFLFPLLYLIH